MRTKAKRGLRKFYIYFDQNILVYSATLVPRDFLAFDKVPLAAHAIANTTSARSDTKIVTPANMNLGAKIFHTIKCLLNHAEHTAEESPTTVR